jgi:hypothetical protein
MLLKVGIASVTLPDDLEWTDEYAWSAVEQAVERTLTGSLVVDVGARVYGRPVTLESGDQVWVSRADVEALQAWASVPGQVLTLTLADARVLTVMFRHHDGVAVEARPVVFMAPLAAADQYLLTLRFMEIE